MGAHAVLRRPRRRQARAPRLLLPRARRGLRPRRIRPHERTHPAPRRTACADRATRTNLSPSSPLYSDPSRASWRALEPWLDGRPWGEQTDDDGTVNRLWRISDPEAIEQVQAALADAELLIADGHHRYETARVYAEEVGGEGEHRYVLMCLVALEDPGLTVFPTHRLLDNLKESATQEKLAAALRESFEIEEIERDELVPEGDGPVRFATSTRSSSAASA